MAVTGVQVQPYLTCPPMQDNSNHSQVWNMAFPCDDAAPVANILVLTSALITYPVI